ncbi:uncharacterized protein LOC126974736 [Leptidea sinapis]|uniref:uncharacterized protein LOC126974736 n=1 Tax=Leptidea sinapis TaxID=189913 RepID=UPI0021208599|nr:uncharacterized protein LOC126974736 [Leptidea sinapis]
MPYYCTVPRCTSMAGKAKNVSFHQFPRDEELAQLWNEVLKRGKPYTKYSKVCSLHFKPDDYTVTSAQKNRGQWRTLRKDAVPSQNLPDSPAPVWSGSSESSSPSLNIDARMHQQMAQAIYVQTIQAMQAAGIADVTLNGLIHNDQPSPSNYSNHDTDSEESNENTPKIISERRNANVTYKCDECSKCFKDPDVFLIHQRVHNSKTIEEKNVEMRRANPMLLNLLNNDIAVSNKNVVSIENQIMSALTANMENYLRNLTTIMTQSSPEFKQNQDGGFVENETVDDTDAEIDNMDASAAIENVSKVSSKNLL